jgi:teichuronic acid biosynthesis glycosyltransferase TuaC
MRVLVVTISWTTSGNPRCAPYIAQQAESLRRAGISVDIVCFRGEKSPINYGRAWREVRDHLKLHECDLIHAHSGQSGVVVLPSPLPLVVTFHGSDLLGVVNARGRYTLGGAMLRFIGQRVAQVADEVILVSKELADYLPGRSCHVIPQGVDRRVFRPMPQEEARAELMLPLDKRFVLFASNPAKLTKRFTLAQASVRLLDGEYAPELLVVADAPHASMPLYMNACDVLLITSFHEGSPTVVKEALACGLPVVSVDVGDIRERIGAVEGCVVCPDEDSETIAAALTSVLSKAKRLETRSELQEVDEKEVTEKVISVYERVLVRR